MKKNYRLITLMMSVILSALLMTACNSDDSSQSSNSSNDDSSAVSQTEIDESGSENASNSDSDEEEISISSASDDASDDESESSSTEESDDESSSDEQNTSSDDESADENTSDSSDYEGYYFDDEQIVEDYHTATVFTSNDEFNELFSDNSISAEYNEALKDADSIVGMRSVTTSYAEIWKQQVDEVYAELYALLEGNSDSITALEDSQQEWEDSLEDIENEFYLEASSDGAGTEALLSADTAMMNYYMGRAAVLYEQIYELTGEFSL